MLAAFIGYIIGRALFGNRAALQILLFGFVLPIAALVMYALHIPMYVLQSVVGVTVAFGMLVGVKRRFFTVPGAFMHALGFAGLIVAWVGFMHLPHVHVAPHHHVHPSLALAWAGFDVVMMRPLAMLASLFYTVLAVYYVTFMVMRQISMEFIFRKYVAWQAGRLPYGSM